MLLVVFVSILMESPGAGDGTCPFGAGEGTLELNELEFCR